MVSSESAVMERRLAALGDSVRLNIVTQLVSGAKTAGDLASTFVISRPAISRHLRVLRSAGIVRAEIRGREWWYSLNGPSLGEVTVYLDEIRRTWASTLESFRHFVEEET